MNKKRRRNPSPGDLPDYHEYVVPAPEIPPIEVGIIDVAEYDLTPEDLTDGKRGPILVDVKGRPVVVQYEKDRNAAEYDSTPEDLTDKTRGPLLCDVKGRLYVRLYEAPQLIGYLTQGTIIRQVDEDLGNTKTFTVPAGKRWRVVAIHTWITTSSTTGTRNYWLRINDENDTPIYHMLFQQPIKSEGVCCDFAGGLTMASWPLATWNKMYPIPNDLTLGPGMYIKIKDDSNIDPTNDRARLYLLAFELP